MNNLNYKEFLTKAVKEQEAKLKDLAIEKIDMENNLDELNREYRGLEGNLQYKRGLLEDLKEWERVTKQL